MENLITGLIMVMMWALIISAISQPLIEGMKNTFQIQNKAVIKVVVFLVELWIVYYVAMFMLGITVWQTLVMITLFVIAGAEVINKIIKSLKDFKQNVGE